MTTSDPKERAADPFPMGMINGEIVTMTEEEARAKMRQNDADDQVADYFDSIDEMGDISEAE